jgi:glutamyl-tRNA synthetase
MLEQGASKNTVNMEWDKIWAYNKKAIDNIAPRYSAICEETAVVLNLDNFDGGDNISCGTKPLHDKNPDLGNKAVQFGKKVYIEKGDAKDFKVGDKITLMKWGNAIVTKCDTSGSDFILHADLKLEDTDYKGTPKLTWVAVDEATNYRVTLTEFDHLITEKKVDDNTKV